MNDYFTIGQERIIFITIGIILGWAITRLYQEFKRIDK